MYSHFLVHVDFKKKNLTKCGLEKSLSILPEIKLYYSNFDSREIIKYQQDTCDG